MMEEIFRRSLPESNGKSLIRRLTNGSTNFDICISGYGDSYINMPEEIPFLEEEFLRELGEYFSLDGEVMADLFRTAGKIKQNRDVLCYTWHIYYRLISLSFSNGVSHGGFWEWFFPEKDLGEDAPIMSALIAMGVLSLARERYRKEGYPEEIIQDTLHVYADELNGMRKEGRKPSIKLGALNWMRVYLAARLVQLGRFNFKLVESNPLGTILQNKRDGRKVMLSCGGFLYNSHGYILQKDDPWAEGGFTAVFEEDQEAYRGNPISPEGYALNGVKTYWKEEWEKILEDGDILIDMHIPAGGGMTPEKCIDSFRKAAAFFSERYPGKFKPVFISHSWIFNTQFEEKLPDSNLAKLMRECYLFPHASNGRDGLFFLFEDSNFKDPSQAPRNTSVRRAALEILESGERLRTGGMLLFAEDLDKFGTCFYRGSFREKE